jgi:hypothetical protein
MRTLALLTLTCGVVLGQAAETSGQVPASGPADSTDTALIRVRSENQEIAGAIARASETSATFRRLMAAIDRTDGLIYVEYGKCGHGVHACLPLDVTAAGPFRILHIKVQAGPPDCHLMATLGHELQHAIEVLSNPSVTTGALAYMLFDRIAGSGVFAYDRRFETDEALRTEAEVSYETCKTRRR